MTLIDRIIRPEVRALKAYAVQPATGMIKLDAMENPFGMPENVRAELGAALAQAEMNRYPPAGADALRAKLRIAMNLPDGFELMLGNGSDELIHLIIQACAREGAVVLAPAPAFVMYEVSSMSNRVDYVSVPVRPDFTLDRDAMLAAIARHAPAVIFLAYPNNPTGTLYDVADIEAILRAAPGLVVIDEAYQPFAGASFMSRLAEFDNLLVMRTLSKLGLAGIRLGYMVARPELIAEFDKLRPPYNINVLTQVAASVVLRHKDVLDGQAALLCEQRALVAAALGELPGVLVYPSAANFLLVRVAAKASAELAGERAGQVFAQLRDCGLLVKNMSAAHPLLNGCLRLTIGSPEENRLLLQALRTILK